MIVVEFIEDLFGDHEADRMTVHGFVPLVELRELEDPVVVGVKEGEDFVEFSFLLHGGHVVVDVGVGGCVEMILELELFETGQGVFEFHGFCLGGEYLFEPGVVQGFFGIQSLFRVSLQ